MVARNKSKKTTSSKKKKTVAASRAKPQVKAEGCLFVQRPNSGQQEQAGVEYPSCTQNEQN